MPTIANYMRKMIEEWELPNSQDSILISIIDMGTLPVKPKSQFKHIYTFQFDDVDEQIEGLQPISNYQAKRIAEIIKQCKDDNVDIFVHCTAGVSRSGAVVEAGLLYGFELPKWHTYGRIPNRTVYNNIRRELGITFSFEE